MVNQLLLSLQSPDDLARCDAIEAADEHLHVPEVRDAVATLFSDNSYLVRCTAYETFDGFADKSIADRLWQRLTKERSACAMVYLCAALGSLLSRIGFGEAEIETIGRLLECVTSVRKKIALWRLRYELEGDEVDLDRILAQLDHKDYRIRSNALHALEDVDDARLLPVYQRRLAVEQIHAVRETLERELRRLKG